MAKQMKQGHDIMEATWQLHARSKDNYIVGAFNPSEKIVKLDHFPK